MKVLHYGHRPGCRGLRTKCFRRRALFWAL